MAKRKRKGRMPLGEKLVILFFALFVLIVAAVFAAGFGNARKLQAQYEAEETAFRDASWIDSQYCLSWIENQWIYHRDEAGVLREEERHVLLQTRSFDGQSAAPLRLDNLLNDERDEVMLIPADDPRGFMVAAHADDLWTLWRVDDGGGIIPAYSQVARTIREILACYDGRIYGHVNRGGNTMLAAVDLQNGDEYLYRSEALCVAPDGRAALMQPRSTGEYVAFTDTDGKKRAAEAEPGWTLGIEDARGSWTPILPVGVDSEFRSVPCAAWLDEDLIFFAWTDGGYTLYRYTSSTGEIAPFPDERGGRIYGQDDILSDSLTVSSDGRHIAYRVRDVLYYDVSFIAVQSLETGRASQISEVGGLYGVSGEGVPIWHQ